MWIQCLKVYKNKEYIISYVVKINKNTFLNFSLKFYVSNEKKTRKIFLKLIKLHNYWIYIYRNIIYII